VYSGGWSPNWVHSAPRPFTVLLWLWGWRIIRWNEDCQGKPKYSEKTCSSATLSTTNPTWPDPGSNPGCRGRKPATNHLSYGAAILFIYLQCSTASDHLQSQYEHKQQHKWDNAERITQKRKIDQLKWFTFKHELLNTSAPLQTAFVSVTHLTAGQWLEEQVNMVKLLMSDNNKG
jgi:hypothetical protein